MIILANITKWLIRGDCHGSFHWMHTQLKDYDKETTGIIILGDAGINFYIDKKDERLKKEVDRLGYYLYLVRGNHEGRPQKVLTDIETIYDENVGGEIMYESKYPHIRYFKDYGIYIINGYRCAVIGGAYSTDKWYRLMRVGIQDTFDPQYFNPKISGWFYNEQLTPIERQNAKNLFLENPNFDFVFTHTCPKKFQPTDLFLSFIDQSEVDESMELWMEEIYNKIVVNFAWCFGHYHADRLERPHIEQYYNAIEELDKIAERWETYDITGELDWWLQKSPNFYWRDE